MECFVYQKHIDLHAVSALEAIHGFMNLTHCKRLSRFVHWIVDVQTECDAVDFFSMITSKSYYLLNPNKEGFVTKLLASNDQDTHSVFVDVFPKESLDNSVLVEKINQHCGTCINHIKKHITWQCDIDISEQSTEFVCSKLLPSDLGGASTFVNSATCSVNFFNKLKPKS